MEQIDLKKITLIELEALGYRLIAQREQVQANPNAVNEEIKLRYQEEEKIKK